jgi:1,2-diacylglycerol 3-alpha-glucosyltransferase
MHTLRVAMVGACPFPTAQGSQVLIQQLSEALAARGHEVHVVTYHLESRTSATPLSGFRVHRIRKIPGYTKIGSGPAWGKIPIDVLLLLLLIRVVLRFKIDVIHAHNYEGLLIGWIAALITGRPVVYHSHNVMAAELPTYFRKSWSRWLARRLAHVLDRQLPRRADICIAMSQEAVSFFRAHGVSHERIRLIPPGIHFEKPAVRDSTAVREQYGLGSGPLVIYTGNLDQYQRLDLLWQSFRHVRTKQPAAQLIIATHSPPQQYRDLAGQLAADDGIRFIHCSSFAQVQTLLAIADIAVCPRIACFGFPIKLLNYMAAGKAIVIARGSAKGIVHMQNGYTVRDGHRALAEGIIHLAQDPELIERLGAAARATFENDYQWANVASQIETCYEQLLADLQMQAIRTHQPAEITPTHI